MPSLAFGGTNQSQEVRGYIQMPFSRNRFYLQESAAWRRTEPVRSTTELPLDIDLAEHHARLRGQRWLRVEGYHAFTRQDNRVAGGEISRHVVGVQFVVSEPMRIR